MSETAHNPETGEYAVRSVGTGWRKVDRETYEAAKRSAETADRGPAANLVREIGSQMQDTAGQAVEAVGGGGVLGQLLGLATGQASITNPAAGGQVTPAARAGADIQQSNDAAQQARYDQYPGIGAAAMVLDPTNFIPVGAVGKGMRASRLGRQAGKRVMGETTAKTVGAAEAVVARSRAAVEGAVSLGADMAESVPVLGPGVRAARANAGGVAQGRARRAESRDMQSINAAASPEQRYRPNLMTEDEIGEFAGGYVPDLPDAMKAKINAQNSDDYARANNAIAESQVRESVNPTVAERLIAGDRQSITGAMEELKETTNRVFMREIGADDTQFPDKSAVGGRMDEISREMNANRELTGPVDADGLLDEITQLTDEVLLSDPTAQSAVEQVRKLIDSKTADDMTMTPDDAAIVENRLLHKIRTAAKSQHDTELVDVLSRIEEKFRDRWSQQMTQEQIQLDRSLRRQWGWAKSALNRASALGEEGVNIKSLLGSKGTKDQGTKQRRSGDNFVRFLDTVDALTTKQRPQTGQTLSRRGRGEL